MFNAFSWLSGAVTSIAGAVTSVIDSINAPESEKEKIKKVVATQINELKLKVLESQNELEKELTLRQKNDMLSDSWLSKNIRPLTLIFLLFLFTVLSLGGWFGFKSDSAILEIIKIWGGLGLSFYFGGRELTKIIKVKNK